MINRRGRFTYILLLVHHKILMTVKIVICVKILNFSLARIEKLWMISLVSIV